MNEFELRIPTYMHQVLTQEEAKEPSEGPLGHAHAKWMEEKINKSGPEDDPPHSIPHCTVTKFFYMVGTRYLCPRLLYY
jgi:hypothetical protein